MLGTTRSGAVRGCWDIDRVQDRADEDVEQLADIADRLGPCNQAFGSEPDADGLFRHLEKLGERRDDPFCVLRCDGGA